MSATATTMSITASDVTGQNKLRVGDVPPSATVGELVKSLLTKMGLVSKDTNGNPIQYRARSRRQGRHLHGSEIIADALAPDDEISLHPRINAG